MDNTSLNEALVAMLNIMSTVVYSPIQVAGNGDVMVKIGKKETVSENILFQDINFVKDTMDGLKIPELSVLLERRILEMQLETVDKKLTLIRGTNG